MKKVLISPSSMGQVGPEPFDLLRQNNFEVINNPYGRKLTEKEVIELGKECLGIIAGVEPLTSEVMDALPSLRIISRVGVGMDSVDMEYAARKGIKVVNTPDAPTRGVAELTIGLTYSLLRLIPQADSDMKQGIWKKKIGNLIYGKRIGIVGLGRIGKMVAAMFRMLGNEVVGYDLYPNKEWAHEYGIVLGTLEETLSQADILTLHVPGSGDNTALITAKEIALMKGGSFIINVSRGGVVDEEDLYHALESNKLSGAAIDVFAEEPYHGPLSNLDNVILTPHLGSYAKEAKLNMEIQAVENFIKLAQD